MGAHYRFRCNQCDYEFIGSGEPDRGFFTATNTFECISCEILFDATVDACMGGYDEDFNDVDAPPLSNNASLTWQPVEVRCPHCKETWSIKIWSAERDGHCPRKVCSGTMQNNQLYSLWD